MVLNRSYILKHYEVQKSHRSSAFTGRFDFCRSAEKKVAIHQYIGKRPVFTAGNSDGDYAMLQWTSTGSGARFGMIVDHTDAEREWAYRKSAMGNLEKGITDAPKYNWVIVSMKTDWKKIYPFEK